MGVPKTSDHIEINIRMPNPSQEPPASSKAPNEDLKDMYVLCTFKTKRDRVKILIIGLTRTIRPIKIKIKMPDFRQEPPASSKVPHHDLKDMDDLCNFEFNIDSIKDH